MATAFVYHPDFLTHDTGSGHAERPERLLSVLKRLKDCGADGLGDEAGRKLLSKIIRVTPDLFELSWIEAVHPSAYVEELRQACLRAPLDLDADTPVSSGSFRAAQLASSAVLEACDGVMTKRFKNAFCAVRPPEHHAETQRAMGFCLFNHVAVGARYLQKKFGLKKILIVDWDVHHGNGTQEIFWNDPSVFYFSTHQFPLYPGTGSESEIGGPQALGTTLNVPMVAGSGDREYQRVFEERLIPAVRVFQPEFILISAGFDAHFKDPLAQMKVTEAGVQELTKTVCRLAQEVCGGRLVSVLEGGYDLDALGSSVLAHLEILTQEN